MTFVFVCVANSCSTVDFEALMIDCFSWSRSNRSRPDINFRGEGSVDRTFICNLEQLRSLFRRQFASKVNVPLDAIQHSLLGFALGAIKSVDLRVPQIDRNFLERPSFPASVHPNRNRSAGQRPVEDHRATVPCLCRPQGECRCSIGRDGERYQTAQSTTALRRCPSIGSLPYPEAATPDGSNRRRPTCAIGLRDCHDHPRKFRSSRRDCRNCRGPASAIRCTCSFGFCRVQCNFFGPKLAGPPILAPNGTAGGAGNRMLLPAAL